MSNFYQIESSSIELLTNIGVSVERLLKKSEIPMNGISDRELFVNHNQYVKLMENLSTMVTNKQILQIGDINNMMMFMPPLFAAMCSKDGKSCFKRLAKYKKLIGPYALKVQETNQSVTIEFTFSDGNKALPKFAVFTELVLTVSMCRKATGQHIRPLRVVTTHDPGDDEFEQFFGIKPIVGQENLIEFSLADMKEPFLTKNNTMWGYLKPELTKRMKELEIDESVSAKVRSVLFELIPAGSYSVDTVAKELAVSSRTLQRKLSGEGTTFIKQLNHTRELLARNYLKDKNISNDDIAFLIGYSDANAFIRAFRNWTGMTTGEYRQKCYER